MSEYEAVKVRKLTIKGEKDKYASVNMITCFDCCFLHRALGSKRKKDKQKKENFARKRSAIKRDEDVIKHGGWWVANTTSQITGHVAIQFGSRYVKALSNGLFTLGRCHAHNEGPDPEEIFTAVVSSNDKVAFKSGYGKYMKAESNNTVTGRSLAVGNLEQWKPMFANGKMALLSALELFMSINPKKEPYITLYKSVTAFEICQVHSIADRKNAVGCIPVDNKINLSVVASNYVYVKFNVIFSLFLILTKIS